MDFAKLAELLDRRHASFVSVTQQFNTNTSMGRLTLNMLLSFAQFEREVIGERIRDKVAASRRKGIWMGGWAPFGYLVRDRKMVIDDAEAETVRWIFRRFVQLGSATLLARELVAKNLTNRYGHELDKGAVYKLLKNRVYVVDAVHKGAAYPGEHQAIIDRKLWDKAHARLGESPRKRGAKNKASSPALLRGLIFDSQGRAMSPTHTRKGGRLYRYYVSQATVKNGPESYQLRIPAGEIDRVVVDQVRQLLATPEVIVATWKEARKTLTHLRESDVRDALLAFQPLWDELFPVEQARIVERLVERVQLQDGNVDVVLRVEGFGSLIAELGDEAAPKRRAA